MNTTPLSPFLVSKSNEEEIRAEKALVKFTKDRISKNLHFLLLKNVPEPQQTLLKSPET